MVFVFSIELKGLRREIHDVEQTRKITPFMTRETCFGQRISKLVFGVNIFDLDCGVQVDSVKQTI